MTKMLRIKFKITISIVLLMLICSASVFSQKTSNEKHPLYTEFIRLKNVPSCLNEKFERQWRITSNCDGYRLGYFKLLNSLKVYLTKRGTIEVDWRSKTIIITDIKKKMTFFKRAIIAFDYPEMYKITEEDFEDHKKYRDYIATEENCGFAGCRNK